MKNNFENSTLEELAQFAIDKITDCKYECYACDLHSEIFNTDYYIIGYYDAEQWLIKHTGVFNGISIIQEYEKDNFGEVNTDLSSSEAIVNMLVYIAGEEVLNSSNHLQRVWNEKLNEEDLQAIIEELTELYLQ